MGAGKTLEVKIVITKKAWPLLLGLLMMLFCIGIVISLAMFSPDSLMP